MRPIPDQSSQVQRTGPATDAVGWSAGGRWFHVEAPLATPLVVAGHVELGCSDGRRFLGQVTRADVSSTSSGRVQVGAGRLLARHTGGDWVPVAIDDAFDDARVVRAAAEAVDRWRSGVLGHGAKLVLGSGRSSGDAPVRLASAGFNRHTFLCGQSGSGKTYALGVLLEQLLLETELRVIVLDPNSDCVHLGELDLPEDPGRSERARSVARRVCVFRGGQGPHRLIVRFGRFPLETQALILALDPLTDADEYHALRRATEAMGTTEYSLATLRGRLDLSEDSRRLALRIDNLGIERWGIWAEEGEAPLLDQLPPDWRAAVLDLGSLGSAAEQSAIAASVLHGLWSRRRAREPVLVVVDEAHNVCPQQPRDHTQAMATAEAVSIAAEGRKFGLYLLLVSQRPQKVHDNVLSQCENLVLMRMNSRSDIEYLARTFSHVPEAMIAQAAGFELGEGLVAGRISPAPALFHTGGRRTPEGGSDVPTTWATGPTADRSDGERRAPLDAASAEVLDNP